MLQPIYTVVGLGTSVDHIEAESFTFLHDTVENALETFNKITTGLIRKYNARQDQYEITLYEHNGENIHLGTFIYEDDYGFQMAVDLLIMGLSTEPMSDEELEDFLNEDSGLN